MYNEAGTIDKMLFERLLKAKGFTEEKIKEIEAILFNLENSHYNRLLWKDDFDTREKYLEVLGLPLESNWDIA